MKNNLLLRCTTVSREDKIEAEEKYGSKEKAKFALGILSLEYYMSELLDEPDYKVPYDICVVVCPNQKANPTEFWYNESMVSTMLEKDHTSIFFVEIVANSKSWKQKVYGKAFLHRGEQNETRFYHRGAISVERYKRYTEEYLLPEDFRINYSLLSMDLMDIPDIRKRIVHIRKTNAFDSGLRFLNRVNYRMYEETQIVVIKNRQKILEEVHDIKQRSAVINVNQLLETHLYQRNGRFDQIDEAKEVTSIILLNCYVYRYPGNYKTFSWFVDTELVLFNARINFLYKYCSERQVIASLMESDIFGYNGINCIKISDIKNNAIKQVKAAIMTLIKKRTMGRFSKRSTARKQEIILSYIMNDLGVSEGDLSEAGVQGIKSETDIVDLTFNFESTERQEKFINQPGDGYCYQILTNKEHEHFLDKLNRATGIQNFFVGRAQKAKEMKKEDYIQFYVIEVPLELYISLETPDMSRVIVSDMKVYFCCDLLKEFMPKYYKYNLKKDLGDKQVESLLKKGSGPLKHCMKEINEIRASAEQIASGKKRPIGDITEREQELPEIEECIERNLYPLCEQTLFWRLLARDNKHLTYPERSAVIHFLYEAGYWYHQVYSFFARNDPQTDKKFKAEIDPRKASIQQRSKLGPNDTFQHKSSYTDRCSKYIDISYTQSGTANDIRGKTGIPETDERIRANFDHRHGCPYFYLKDELDELDLLLKRMGIKDYRKRNEVTEKARLNEPRIACKLTLEILHGVGDDGIIVNKPGDYLTKSLALTQNGKKVGSVNTNDYDIFLSSRKKMKEDVQDL
jgi:hypothetical protein